MKTTCANCQTTLTHTAVGDFCLRCGIIYHHTDYPDPKPAPVRVTHSFANHTPAHVIDGVTPTQKPKPSLNAAIVPAIKPHTYQSPAAKPSHQHTRADYIRLTSQARPPKAARKSRHRTAKALALTASMGLALAVMIGISWRVSKSDPSPAASRATFAAPNAEPVTVSQSVRIRDEARKRDLGEIATALNIYHSQNGAYPAGSDIGVLTPLQYTNPPYINQINLDPASDPAHNRPVRYSYHSDGVHFQLQAKLEDPTDRQAQNGVYTVSD